jgi:hypothetical protein
MNANTFGRRLEATVEAERANRKRQLEAESADSGKREFEVDKAGSKGEIVEAERVKRKKSTEKLERSLETERQGFEQAFERGKVDPMTQFTVLKGTFDNVMKTFHWAGYIYRDLFAINHG